MQHNPQSFFQSCLLIAKGFCMGAADVVPGVSGGTMALILGIYRQLIDAIKSFDTQWIASIIRLDFASVLQRPHFGFLIPLAIGIFSAIIFFTRVVSIPSMLTTHPEHIYGLFFGLIAGSVILLLRTEKATHVLDYATIAIGIVVGAVIVTAVPTSTPNDWWFISLAGAVAICAMVLPGISGSFILLILGKYAYVLDGIGNFKLNIIVPFAIGAGLGLMLFTRFLSWLLHRFERTTMFVIVGILIASLWVIWPFQEREYVIVREKKRLLSSQPVIPEDLSNLPAVAGLILIGIFTVLFVNWLGNKTATNKPSL